MALPLVAFLPLTFSTGVFAVGGGSSVPANLSASFGEGKQDYILSASILAGTLNCGPTQPIANGWTVDAEALFDHTGVTNNTQVLATGGYFSAGTFTAPVNGFYHVSAYARIETQAGDITLRHNGVPVAGFGTDLVERIEGGSGNTAGVWASHGVSKHIYLSSGDQLTLWHESGQSDDCSIETSFHYGQFNVNLIRAVGS